MTNAEIASRCAEVLQLKTVGGVSLKDQSGKTYGHVEDWNPAEKIDQAYMLEENIKSKNDPRLVERYVDCLKRMIFIVNGKTDTDYVIRNGRGFYEHDEFDFIHATARQRSLSYLAAQAIAPLPEMPKE